MTPPVQDVSEPFDPYRQWLGIADQQRPLNHYALLGLDPGESDREKIWSLAQRQMDHVLEIDPSLQNPHVRRIFAELEAARDCLCNQQKRQEHLPKYAEWRGIEILGGLDQILVESRKPGSYHQDNNGQIEQHMRGNDRP